MKDKPHDEAMAEVYRNDPEQAAAVLAAVEADGDPAELVIVRRQLAMAGFPCSLSLADLECFAQALLSPPKPAPALERAVTRRSKLLRAE